jgi:hypothetical protein
MIMKNELARELRKAGFVFKFHIVVGDGINTEDSFEEHDPTLEELIEACGNELRNLMADDTTGTRRWVANSDLYLFGDAYGSTPTEAVARLWIALHAHGDATA